MSPLAVFASTESTTDGGPMAALGIDWTLLVFQLIAFTLLVWALGKWVYPVFIRAIDKRQAMIEESTKAAVDAEKHAKKAQDEISGMLSDARREAGEIVATAKEEAGAMITKADEKAKANAKRIVAQAHESIAKDVLAAKKELHNETIDLVAAATEKVVGKAVDAKVDKTLIKEALK